MHGYITNGMPNKIRVALTQRPEDSPMAGSGMPILRAKQRAKCLESPNPKTFSHVIGKKAPRHYPPCKSRPTSTLKGKNTL